jgi:hypothetical protein
MSTFLEIKLRYATKKFDASKNNNKEDLNTLKEAIRLFFLWITTYKIILVENPELRAKYNLLPGVNLK